uniref:Uncharacterized protein n=1 Tax=Arundo donax TaxID=35708 RepID=A0A0A9FWV6_ARUDO
MTPARRRPRWRWTEAEPPAHRTRRRKPSWRRTARTLSPTTGRRTRTRRASGRWWRRSPVRRHPPRRHRGRENRRVRRSGGQRSPAPPRTPWPRGR